MYTEYFFVSHLTRYTGFMDQKYTLDDFQLFDQINPFINNRDKIATSR